MSTVNLNIRIEKEIKANAEKIFDALGLNMTTAVNIFLRQVIQENGLPFEVKLNSAPQFDTAENDSDEAEKEKSIKDKSVSKDSWVFDVNS